MASIQRFFRSPPGSFFLFGPRGTGKTTWLRHAWPDAPFVDLLDAAALRNYVARPERLADLVHGSPHARQVVVDEVQKAPALLTVVHQLIEERPRREVQFILTVSSARKLKRTGVDLLAGRLALRTMHPFMAAELGDRFSLASALRLGTLPVVLGAADPEEALRSYVGLYMREEVQAEAVVRDIGGFARFMEVVSLSHGAMLNASQVARECYVARTTVEGYVNVLEDLLLAFRLPPFTRRARRQLVHHPKFYYMDAGVYRSVRPQGPLDRTEEIGGGCLEGLVAQHLRAWIAYSKGRRDMFFWRTKDGVEVDFVVYGEDDFFAVEVKSSRDVYPRDVRSLRAFLTDYPQAQACLLYCGRERLKINGVFCLPCEDFLRRLAPNERAPIP